MPAATARKRWARWTFRASQAGDRPPCNRPQCRECRGRRPSWPFGRRLLQHRRLRPLCLKPLAHGDHSSSGPSARSRTHIASEEPSTSRLQLSPPGAVVPGIRGQTQPLGTTATAGSWNQPSRAGRVGSLTQCPQPPTGLGSGLARSFGPQTRKSPWGCRTDSRRARRNDPHRDSTHPRRRMPSRQPSPLESAQQTRHLVGDAQAFLAAEGSGGRRRGAAGSGARS